jgi:hypothetical protein
MGTDVLKGHLYLVTPMGNAPGTTCGLRAFLRITNGTNTVLEITSPTEFNVYKDVAALQTNGATISTLALNRFSIDSGSVHTELRGISTWKIFQKLVDGVDVSGTGLFQCGANGWVAIYNVAQEDVPVSGQIVAGRPLPGP